MFDITCFLIIFTLFSRYCDGNIKLSNVYRQYAGFVPEFLKNRPRELIEHCLSKIELASSIDESQIRMTGNGQFKVKSNSRNPLCEPYHVCFGDAATMPSCTCMDWRSSAFPCKHFFAVFTKFPQFSWDSLSPLYIDSPFLKLDDVVINNLQISDDNSTFTSQVRAQEDTGSESSTKDSSNDLPLEETRENQVRAVNYGPSCRQMIDEIRRLTFLVEDQSELLSGVLANLVDIKKGMYDACPKENDIALLPTISKGRKVNSEVVLAKRLQELPPRRRKIKFAQRVGERNERHAKAAKLSVEDRLEDSKHQCVLEEVISDATDLSINAFSVPVVNKVHENIQEKEGESYKRSLKLLFLGKAAAGSSKADAIELGEDVSTNEGNDKPFPGDSVRSELTYRDLKSISDKRVLSDNVINVLQLMMKRDFNISAGLQDTIKGRKLYFKSIKPGVPFAQILHDEQNHHWVAISSYGCNEGEICYMDSLFKGRIANEVKQQICTIMKCKLPAITVKVVSVQQQNNGIDCGLFALAFTQCVLEGKKDVASDFFDDVQMRSHLLHVILENKMSSFPVSSIEKRRCKSRVIEIKVFCSCRHLWIETDKQNPSKYVNFFLVVNANFTSLYISARLVVQSKDYQKDYYPKQRLYASASHELHRPSFMLSNLLFQTLSILKAGFHSVPSLSRLPF